MSEIISLKNVILQVMRSTSNNLFTFAKAWPLVTMSEQGPVSIGEITRSTFDLAGKIHNSFGSTGMELQVNFDLLTESFLKRVAKYGTRLLHVTSDLVSEDHLCVEGQNGVCERIHIDDLYNLFESHCEHIDPETKKKKLQIDIVAIAIPESVKIG